MEHTLPPYFERVRLRIKGQVQGVGFRPYIFNLANEAALSGWVKNDGEGVLIEAQGQFAQEFKIRIQDNPPQLSRIESIEELIIAPVMKETVFEILASREGVVKTSIPPDAAVCPDCLYELFDPNNKRYGFPFINCTHCGPRYSITSALPYDRAQTSMAPFEMCSNCETEYEDPHDRRFHAQPTCCPDCGPALSHSIKEIADFIKAGKIITLKGLGGFHLVCDASNDKAIKLLRKRKNRPAKPFAIMVQSHEHASQYAEMTALGRKMITSPQAPIVLFQTHPENELPASLAPGLNKIGIMLPYTPIHHLLMAELDGLPLVMTSANPGGEPLVIDNEEARQRLGEICDEIVDHNRDILIRVDDSLLAVNHGKTIFMRRARGYTPSPIPVEASSGQVIAMGSLLKNTICLTKDQKAYVSQHIGDLDTVASLGFYEETLNHLVDTLEIKPELIVQDAHPDFATQRLAEKFDIDIINVQHHHAHIASVMAEHGLEEPVIGVALDGFGLSLEGEMWGGELLKVEPLHFERLGHLKTRAQPGGDVAAKQPWRMAVSALYEMGYNKIIEQKFSHHNDLDILLTMLDKNINSPKTSSAGRLFDTACGMLGLVENALYEGHAPMLLESLVDHPKAVDQGWEIHNGVLDFSNLLEKLINLSPDIGANLFHGTLIEGLFDWIYQACHEQNLDTVCLSGGCFQNQTLLNGLESKLMKSGFHVYTNENVPANDGGISLGQAFIGLHHLKKNGERN